MKNELKKKIEECSDYKKYGGMSVGEDVDVLTPEEIEELRNETEEENAKR